MTLDMTPEEGLKNNATATSSDSFDVLAESRSESAELRLDSAASINELQVAVEDHREYFLEQNPTPEEQVLFNTAYEKCIHVISVYRTYFDDMDDVVLSEEDIDILQQVTDEVVRLAVTAESMSHEQHESDPQPDSADVVGSVAAAVMDTTPQPVEDPVMFSDYTDTASVEAGTSSDSVLSEVHSENIEQESVNFLYGMSVPQAGPERRFGALSFREGVKLAMINDPEFVSFPAKKVLVEQMLQVVGYVPDAGLSAEDVMRLNDLVGQIDALSNSEVSIASEFVDTESPDEALVEKEELLMVPENKRKKLILADLDAVEQTLPIAHNEMQKVSEEIAFADIGPDSKMSDFVVEEPVVVEQEEMSEGISEIEVADAQIIAAVKQIESEQMSWVDSTFGTYKSPYTEFSETSFDDLYSQANAPIGSQEQQLFRGFLKEHNIKYEVFNEWQKHFVAMFDFVPDLDTKGMTFKEVVDVYLKVVIAS
jgi:hypothetical protein